MEHHMNDEPEKASRACFADLIISLFLFIKQPSSKAQQDVRFYLDEDKRMG